MREIKFRGKKKYDGEWTYGLLHYSNLGNKLKLCIQTLKYDEDGSVWSTSSEEVDVNTIGQDTGLKGLNGKEIYEGDLLLYSDSEVYEVSIDNYKFQLNGFYNSHFDNPEDGFSEGVFKIVGNIHDNPEWLEV